MKMNTYSINTMQGVLVSILVLAVFVLTSRLGDFANGHYLIKAEFENIGGLKAHSNVMIDDRVVGKVRGIDYNNDGYTAVVSMLIESGYQLPVDTTASVLSSGMLAEHYIGLDPGAEEEYLKSDELIRLSQPALAFEQVMGWLLYSRGEEDLIGEKNL
ncbi:MAG: MlaD family protein [Gammaproteobacteria bacterium]|nr:MlaD family protein [Gammaproteobacteria bacterium]